MAVNDQEQAANERLARLYHDAAHEEPPSHLDASICRAARASGGARPSPGQAWWAPWRLPFALAAVGIVSVSLVTLMVEEGGEHLTHVPRGPVPADSRLPAPLEAQPPAASAPSREPSLQRDSPPPAPAAQPLQRRERIKTLDEGAAAKAEVPAAGRDSRPGASSSQAPPLSGEVAAARPSEEAGMETARAPRPPASPSLEVQAGAPAADRRSAPAAQRLPAPQVAARPMQKAERLAASSAPVAKEVATLEAELPAVWLERILVLRREGRREDADALLVEFNTRFPGAALPPQLQ